MRNYITGIICFSFLLSFGQNNAQQGKNVFDNKYDRVSLSYLLIDHNNSYSKDLTDFIENYKVEDKYNSNDIKKKIIKVSQTTNDLAGVRQEYDGSYLLNLIQKESISNMIVAKWFNRQPDGSFDMTKIYERGRYNATDADVMIAKSDKKGTRVLEDAGEKLLNLSYIILLDYNNIQTMEQFYDKEDEKAIAAARKNNTSYTPVVRENRGYQGYINAYIYKMDFNDSITAIFYNNLWINKDDPDSIKQREINEFNNTDFPFKYISAIKIKLPIYGMQKINEKNQSTDNQLLYLLFQDGIENVSSKVEKNYEDFKVKTPLYSVKPISAKIGLKEGVGTDQRYFIYEYVQNPDGTIKPVRKGAVRATHKITDNQKESSGQTKPTKFYQIGGRKLEEGMLMKQKTDLGYGLVVGYGINYFNKVNNNDKALSFGNGGYYYARLEINLSQNMARYFKSNWPHSIKLFVETMQSQTVYQHYRLNMATYLAPNMGYEVADLYNLLNSKYNVAQTLQSKESTWFFGISKDVYFARNYQWTPFISYGIGKQKLAADNGFASSKPDNNGDYSIFNHKKDTVMTRIKNIALGSRFGMNLSNSVQLVFSVNYDIRIFNYKFKQEELWLPEEFNKQKSGLSLSLGLKCQF